MTVDAGHRWYPAAGRAWNLHLTDTSLLIGAGDPVQLNPDGSTSDIGAYGGGEADLWDLDWDGFDEYWLPGVYDAAPSTGMDCDDRAGSVYPGHGC